MKFATLKTISGLILALAISACGGGGPGADASANRTAAGITSSGGSSGISSGGNRPTTGPNAPLTPSQPDTAPTPSTPVPATLTPAAASHFLAQATFGPTPAGIAALTTSSKAAWIADQFRKPQTSHRNTVQSVAAQLPPGILSENQVFESFWRQAAIGDDQLRQRVTFALSQIFVISMADPNLVSRPAGVASYYDTLGQNAFGNFRNLLQAVALHPMMGIYLSHMRNQKESGNRVPDENFAREVMQLMSIGLYELNPDGSLKQQNGRPVETYTHDDVAGMAKVFTGWSWAGPDKAPNRFNGNLADPNRDWTPMQNYPAYHSTSAKSFLGTTIGAGGTGETDMKAALDTLFQHPNVGPFIGRQLIQRLVSSNPSPAYVSRVAAAFADNGSGVRGDMQAVIRAVLLDPEAADTGSAKKLREPVLRMANWMRAFNAKSASGRFQIHITDDPLYALAQSPLRAPSVFNFFRPSYTPPNTSLSTRGLVAPEMQITGEPSVTGYLNFIQYLIPYGAGSARDVQPDYSAELALTGQPAQLVDRINLLLLNGGMTSTLRNQIISAVNSVNIPPPSAAFPTRTDDARRNRVYLAIVLAMASPEYLAQR
ncbi:DUF1800 domain-containing protein [Rugamonas rivuli]|uniref:DUF1800 family protein n=1 Tax=Rugamonas rivuli TaxID=2743358 RepID=A0A843S3A6_9BURK|nr:DUF1800 domain-containing protein [Rugamonas rivuli]MQA18755.1 DUF1800 family protein [Rugamonas rivuli]